MGSPCEIHLYARRPGLARLAASRAIADIRRVERRYSRYLNDNVTAAINAAGAAGGALEVDEETAALLDYAATCHAESDGLFDISAGVLRQAWDFQSARLPPPGSLEPLLARVGWQHVRWHKPRLAFTRAGMELDFGGIGKEYAADRAANLCLETGIEHGLVNLGGDIRAIAPHPDGSPWRVGIRHPFQADGLLATVALAWGGLASSGDYARCIDIGGQRYCHILNPKTGWPVRGLAAVSVIAPQCLIAGSASTIAMLRGQGGGAWLAGLGLPHLWMDSEGRLGGTLGAV